jgi:hypothetical protein
MRKTSGTNALVPGIVSNFDSEDALRVASRFANAHAKSVPYQSSNLILPHSTSI